MQEHIQCSGHLNCPLERDGWWKHVLYCYVSEDIQFYGESVEAEIEFNGKICE